MRVTRAQNEIAPSALFAGALFRFRTAAQRKTARPVTQA